MLISGEYYNFRQLGLPLADRLQFFSAFGVLFFYCFRTNNIQISQFFSKSREKHLWNSVEARLYKPLFGMSVETFERMMSKIPKQ